MDIHLDKARKLIDQLEKTLNETSSHTASARKVLGEWMTKGEATLRNKSAAALKQVRKRADRFTKALTDLEKSLGKSLDKLSDKVAAKPAITKKRAAPAKKRTPVKKAAKPAAKKTRAAKQ